MTKHKHHLQECMNKVYPVKNIKVPVPVTAESQLAIYHMQKRAALKAKELTEGQDYETSE